MYYPKGFVGWDKQHSYGNLYHISNQNIFGICLTLFSEIDPNIQFPLFRPDSMPETFKLHIQELNNNDSC